MRNIYFDHAASTPLRAKSLETLKQSYEVDYANPSASHRPGRKLMEKIQECRQFFYEALAINPSHNFIFTSSASESNSLILQNLLRSFTSQELVLFSSADHPSLTSILFNFHGTSQSKMGFQEIPLLPSGMINFDEFIKILSLKPSLIILSHVNNHSGNIHPIESIASKVKILSPSTHIHIDASQSFGKFPLSLKSGNFDSMSFSAHKMGGPKGIGGLYFNNSTKITPLIFGGGQENGFRSSTVNAPLIFSWTQAAKEALLEIKNPQFILKIKKMNFDFRVSIKEKIPQIIFPFNINETSPFICTFIIPQIPSDIIIRHLEEKNIYLSSSSACSSKIKGHNPIFEALHLDTNLHKNVLRLSMSHLSTEEELADLIEALESIMNSLTTLISPYSRRSFR